VAVLVYGLGARAAQYQPGVVLFTPQDTFLGLDALNHSAADTLNAYTWPDYQVANAIVLKFDLASMPSGAVIDNASLRLSLVGADDSADGGYAISAHKILSTNPDITKVSGFTVDGTIPWAPAACCYQNIPLAQGNLSQPYATEAVDQKLGRKSWDVTTLVREWVHDPATNFGLVLNSDASKPRDRFRVFASTEHADTRLKPYLEVRYAAPDATPPTVTLTSPVDGDVSGTVRLAATALDNVSVAAVQFRLNGTSLGPEQPTGSAEMAWDTTSVSDGAYTLTAVARDWAGLTASSAGVAVTVYNGVLRLVPQDTFLNVDTKNYSQAGTLSAYTWPDRRVANAIALLFNLSPVPAGATISDAALQMALVESDTTSDATYYVSAHKLTKRPDIASATGFKADGQTSWTPSACCANEASLAQADISAPYDVEAIDRQNGFKTWKVTALVQEWLSSPATNQGLLLNGDATRGRDRFRRFASTEHADATLRPYLKISYTRAEGAPTSTSTSLATTMAAGGSTRDRTAPTVSLTAPSAGASVSGTVTVSATAGDNVGVTSVQFRLDGANLGAADTTAPFAISWNTTTASNGTHTLTARARDAAGNLRTSSSVTVSVSNAPSGVGTPIAVAYPGDVGIETHPDVVMVERFEDSIGGVFGRWTDIRNGAGMSLVGDVPGGSSGTRSLNIPWIGGGVSTGGHLYKQLTTGIDDVLYVRYYIKYPTSGQYQHTGIWMGGYNPSLAWPNPQAGTKPAGSDRFIAAAEQNTLTNRFDHYNYWMNMRPSSDGMFWGNHLLNNEGVQAKTGQWMCVEQMVKLNNPVSASNGEHAIWMDDVKVSHLGQGFPNGTWSGGIFTQTATGTPFEGFRWRSDSNLKLNWIWLQNYASADPAGFTANMLFDHVVVARRRIGCLTSAAPPAPSPDSTLPSVSVTTPLSGATVAGTAVTVAASASDNVGVAGVQFKLDGANLGIEDTSAPYTFAWNTTAVSNGTHALTAVARDAAGNTRTSSSVSVTVSNGIAGGGGGASWPNEPLGFKMLTDMAWSALTGNGWNYLRRSSSKHDDIVSDSAAPLSPLQLLRIVFTPDMPRDTGPSVHWIGLPSRPREMFTGWWMKMSPNWSASPAGGGKITFAWSQNGQGQVYSNIGGSAAPHRININTEWAPYGQKFWEPNVTTTPVNYNQWYRIEWYLKWESTPGASDGVMRWWVNGVLNGDHRNVRFPDIAGFEQFEYAPTRQNSPLSEEYLFIDHTRVSTP
jgi:hypothetical protein